jgi:hypothetical protein
LNVNEPPSVGGMTVPPETVLPLSSTFHIATVRTAAPLPFASDLACALKVHRPGAKLIRPEASTIHPAHEDGIDGVDALTAVFATELPRLVPGMNGAQPVVLSATRLSACGRSDPDVAVLVSTYVVVGPGFVPSRMYVPVFVLAGIFAR